MKVTEEQFRQAKMFLYANARLLDRKRYEYHFEAGPAESVIAVLRAYQNEDGGFGNALEPDIRCPQSQPVPTEMALHVMDEVGLYDESIVRGIMRYFERSALPSGGLPLVGPDLHRYPYPPWWKDVPTNVASVNPTGSIVALLLKQQAVPVAVAGGPAWLEQAVRFLWDNLERINLSFYHDLIHVIAFLRQMPDDPRTAAALASLDRSLAAPGVIERDPHAGGYVHKVLDWVTEPDSYCAKFVDAETLALHLDAMVAGQQPDGGWPISWEALSPAATMEWRGWATVNRLTTLKAHGRL